MAARHEVKRRLKAVSNTKQTTKAMEMVAAAKMRKTQIAALFSRPYGREILRLLDYLQTKTNYVSTLMRARAAASSLIVVISSDRGFAGSFNSNIFRELEAFLKIEALKKSGEQQLFAAVGKKAKEYITRRKFNLVKSFERFGDYIELEPVEPLAAFILAGYLEKKWDRVVFISGHFRTTLKQDFLVSELLPLEISKVRELFRTLVPPSGRFANFTGLEEPERAVPFEYLIEPDTVSVLEAVTPRLLDVLIYYLILHSNAAEHSSRVVAMKQASDNAKEVEEHLKLDYNKSRQGAITQELIEIVSGV
ncbi:MAG: ATP synthase F1 subunit gamma [Parcubacteria group bacterium]|nr:ATP synthase F1 subunit gamma [Parcubacteria group bacterium]